MSDWTIEPFESLGALRFGMRKGEAQQVLGEPPKEFHKGFSENVTEAYNGTGVHVYYDADATVEFIEVFPPSRPTFRGIDLMRPDAAAVIADLAKLGLTVRDDGEGGLWFDKEGFSLFAPAGKTEGVSVFRRGYDTGAQRLIPQSAGRGQPVAAYLRASIRLVGILRGPSQAIFTPWSWIS